MKSKVLFFVLSVFLLVVSASCSKPTSHFGNAVYTGKVIRAICGNITIQCTSGEKMGQMSWVDQNDPDRIVYDNVFKVANPCNWGKTGNGDMVKFKIVPASKQDCAQCLLFVATPDVAYSIQVIE